jgi:hypothetical protein
LKYSTLELAIELCDSTATDKEVDQTIRSLKSDLEAMPEVEAVRRVADPHVPEGSKSGGDFLNKLLNADVTPANCLKILTFLGERLGNKPLKLRIKKDGGEEVELEASSREEFEYLKQQAQEFLSGT